MDDCCVTMFSGGNIYKMNGSTLDSSRKELPDESSNFESKLDLLNNVIIHCTLYIFRFVGPIQNTDFKEVNSRFVAGPFPGVCQLIVG